MTHTSKILAIDTSSALCSVALMISQTIFVRQTDLPRQAAQSLLPLIDELLQEAGYTLRSLDGVAIASGPGSFTGLRIGIGAAQGLAMAAGITTFPVSNLAISAFSAIKESTDTGALVCDIARDGEYYFAAYVPDPVFGVKLLGGEQVASVSELVFSPDESVTNWIGVGEAWTHTAVLNAFPQLQLADTIMSNELEIADLCGLAQFLLQAGKGVSPEKLRPNYIKEQLDYLV